MNESIKVLIVGAGPRGLSAVERITAQVAAADSTSSARDVEVTWVDPFEHGPGKVWRTDQSSRYLMNTPSLFPTVVPDAPELASSLVPMSFDQWREFAREASNAVVLPEDAAEELAALTRTDYPSRRLYGHYLRWVREQLMARLPARMRVELVRGEVRSVNYDGEWLATVGRPGGDEVLVRADAVVLALGHVPAKLSPVHAALLQVASDAEGLGARGVARGVTYIPPQVPADIDWDVIPAAEPVLVRGMGLNFFDIMVQLTEGRGGRFVRGDGGSGRAGSLEYVPSGAEPRLVVGSRRGTPYRAKAALEGYVPRRSVLRSLTLELVAEVAARGEQLSFDVDVWPLLREDVQRNFAEAGGAGEFSIEALAMPFAGVGVMSAAEYQDLVRSYLEEDLARALRGEQDPVNIAIGTLNAGRSVVKAVAAAGLLTDESWHTDLRGWFEPLVEGLASGPPAVRIAQLLALHRAGLVEFLGPYPEFDAGSAGSRGSASVAATAGFAGATGVDGAVSLDVTASLDGAAGFAGGMSSAGGFRAVSATVPETEYRASTLIEAMMPANRVAVTDSLLLRQMLSEGVVRARTVALGGHEVVKGSGLDVSRSDLQALSADGDSARGLYVLGLQLSSVEWGTAIAAESGAPIEAGGRTLLDADVIATQILGGS